MSIKVEGALKFADDFRREHLKARKKAGRKVGGEIVREQRAHLKRIFRKASPLRLKRIQSCVGRGNGDLVLFDNAPSAAAHEEGKTILPMRRKFLALMTGEGSRGKGLQEMFSKGMVFIIRNAKGNAVVMRKLGGGRAEPVATLLKKAKLPKRLGFRNRILTRLSEYVAEVEKSLAGG